MGDPEGFASDPPILVGGGGSTLIWVRKDFEPEIIEGAKVNNSLKLQHPENYRIYRYGNLEITRSTVRAKEGEHCKHDKLSKDHLTWFD